MEISDFQDSEPLSDLPDHNAIQNLADIISQRKLAQKAKIEHGIKSEQQCINSDNIPHLNIAHQPITNTFRHPQRVNKPKLSTVKVESISNNAQIQSPPNLPYAPKQKKPNLQLYHIYSLPLKPNISNKVARQKKQNKTITNTVSIIISGGVENVTKSKQTIEQWKQKAFHYIKKQKSKEKENKQVCNQSQLFDFFGQFMKKEKQRQFLRLQPQIPYFLNQSQEPYIEDQFAPQIPQIFVRTSEAQPANQIQANTNIIDLISQDESQEQVINHDSQPQNFQNNGNYSNEPEINNKQSHKNIQFADEDQFSQGDLPQNLTQGDFISRHWKMTDQKDSLFSQFSSCFSYYQFPPDVKASYLDKLKKKQLDLVRESSQQRNEEQITQEKYFPMKKQKREFIVIKANLKRLKKLFKYLLVTMKPDQILPIIQAYLQQPLGIFKKDKEKQIISVIDEGYYPQIPVEQSQGISSHQRIVFEKQKSQPSAILLSHQDENVENLDNCIVIQSQDNHGNSRLSNNIFIQSQENHANSRVSSIIVVQSQENHGNSRLSSNIVVQSSENHGNSILSNNNENDKEQFNQPNQANCIENLNQPFVGRPQNIPGFKNSKWRYQKLTSNQMTQILSDIEKVRIFLNNFLPSHIAAITLELTDEELLKTYKGIIKSMQRQQLKSHIQKMNLLKKNEKKTNNTNNPGQTQQNNDELFRKRERGELQCFITDQVIDCSERAPDKMHKNQDGQYNRKSNTNLQQLTLSGKKISKVAQQLSDFFKKP